MKKIFYLIIIIFLSCNKEDLKNINILKKKNKKLIDFENEIKSKKNNIFPYTNQILYDGYTTAGILNQEDNFKIISKTLKIINHYV